MKKNRDDYEIDLKEFHKTLNKLIKDGKITFGYYKSSSKLDLLLNIHNKVDNTIDLRFRDTMGDHIKELREIMEKTSK